MWNYQPPETSTLQPKEQNVIPLSLAKIKQMYYFLDNVLLMCRWTSGVSEEMDCSETYQVVVPTSYRSQILSIAHDHPWSGHMGITKTYERVFRHFFWPGLKSDVVHYCRTSCVSSRWKTKSSDTSTSPSPLPYSSNGLAV